MFLCDCWETSAFICCVYDSQAIMFHLQWGSALPENTRPPRGAYITAVQSSFLSILSSLRHRSGLEWDVDRLDFRGPGGFQWIMFSTNDFNQSFLIQRLSWTQHRNKLLENVVLLKKILYRGMITMKEIKKQQGSKHSKLMLMAWGWFCVALSAAVVNMWSGIIRW